MRPIRVLLVLHDLGLTGAAKVALDAFESFADKVDVRIVALAGGERFERCIKIGHTQVIPWGGHISRLRAKLVAIPLSRSLAGWQPDVIYINSAASLHVFDRMKLPNVPIIMHIHELDSYLSKYAESHAEQLLRLPKKYIAVSNAVRTNLINNRGIEEDKVALIHAFVNESDYDSVNFQSKEAGGPFVVGGSGFPVWRKGMDLWMLTAAETAKLLGEDAVQFRWIGVPPKDYTWTFDYMVQKLQLQGIVSRTEPVRQPLLEYNDFDAFAMTSWEDPFPLVVLENMMLRKPVLCFDGSGGAPEQVGDAGFVIPEFSPKKMAEAIAELASSPQRRNEMGAAARERVLGNFTSSINSPKIYDVIRSVVGGDKL